MSIDDWKLRMEQLTSVNWRLEVKELAISEPQVLSKMFGSLFGLDALDSFGGWGGGNFYFICLDF